MADAEFWHKTADERAAELTRWRDIASKLCDALDRVLYEDSAKSEECRLTDRVCAAQMMHIARSELLPSKPAATDQS